MLDLNQALADTETTATALLAVCVDRWGTDCLAYEPETIEHGFADLGIGIPEENLEKILALQTVYTTDLFYNSLAVFLNVVTVLAGNGSQFGEIDPPEPEDIAAAVAEVQMNMPLEEGETLENLFCVDIKVFTRKLLDYNAVHKAPELLEWCGERPESEAASVDDPVLFSAYVKAQQMLREEIGAAAEERVSRILFELENLPLSHRDNRTFGALLQGAAQRG